MLGKLGGYRGLKYVKEPLERVSRDDGDGNVGSWKQNVSGLETECCIVIGYILESSLCV